MRGPGFSGPQFFVAVAANARMTFGALRQCSQCDLGVFMLAAYNQLSSVEKSEQAITATNRPAVLHVLEIDNRAAMNSYETRRTQACVELL